MSILEGSIAQIIVVCLETTIIHRPEAAIVPFGSQKTSDFFQVSHLPVLQSHCLRQQLGRAGLACGLSVELFYVICSVLAEQNIS